MTDDLSNYESPLSRAKRVTQEQVNKGYLAPWVMGDYEGRDRYWNAIDRRNGFQVINGGKLQSKSNL